MPSKKKYVYEWPRPMVTVDAIVLKLSGDKVKVLLIKRRNDPFRGLWAIPGGFVDMDEDLPDAAARELAEETGIRGLKLEQMHTFGKPGRDPRGRNVTVAYMAVIGTEKVKVKAGDDAAKTKWFDTDKLPKLAFDHNEVIAAAAAKLKKRRKVMS
jgi:8-oxo-dGTP diphosphatase